MALDPTIKFAVFDETRNFIENKIEQWKKHLAEAEANIKRIEGLIAIGRGNFDVARALSDWKSKAVSYSQHVEAYDAILNTIREHN